MIYFPSAQLDFIGKKEILMRWGLILLAGLFFIENRYLLAWFVWLWFCMVSKDSQTASNEMYRMLLFILLYTGLTHIKSGKYMGWIMNAVCLIILAQAAFIILEMFDIKTIYWVDPKFNTSGMYAGAMAETMTAGSLLAIGMHAFLKGKWRYCLILVVPLLFQQRALAAVLAAAGGAFVWLWLTFKERKSTLITASLVILASILLYAWQFEGVKHQGLRSTYYGRQLYAISQAPLRGYGLGSFKYIFPVMDAALFENKTGATHRRAHSDLHQEAFDQGIPGVVLMGLFIGNACKRYRKRQPFLTKTASNYGNIALAGISAACINAVFHFLIRTPVVLIAIFYMALLEYCTYEGTTSFLNTDRRFPLT